MTDLAGGRDILAESSKAVGVTCDLHGGGT
jgi:hypothetical protein